MNGGGKMANTVAQTQKNSRKTIWIVIAAIVFVVSFLVPAPAGLDPAGKQCVFLVIIALILLLSNCVEYRRSWLSPVCPAAHHGGYIQFCRLAGHLVHDVNLVPDCVFRPVCCHHQHFYPQAYPRFPDENLRSKDQPSAPGRHDRHGLHLHVDVQYSFCGASHVFHTCSDQRH